MEHSSPRGGPVPFATLAVAAMLAPIVVILGGIALGGDGLWNDFASYWLAGRLVLSGQSPYDVEAIVRLGRDYGIPFLAGTGYSYPLPFAVAFIPLSLLPFVAAGTIFTAVSLLAFGMAVAAWLRDGRLFDGRPRAALAAALLAGLYPPVSQSLFFGQANLLVLAAVATGVRLLVDGRRQAAGGIWIALGAVVKVAPLALLLPMVLARRWRAAAGLVLGAIALMLAAAVVAPFGVVGEGSLAALAEPDPYWTNQSLNGLASRLALGNERTVPLLAGVDPAVLSTAMLVAFGALTLAVLLRAHRAQLTPGGFAVAVAFVLVAATAGAPKNSFWNHAPALISAGLLVSPVAGRASLRAVDGWLVTAWLLLAGTQWWVDTLPWAFLRALGPASAVLTSAALLSLLVLWCAAGLRLLRLTPTPGPLPSGPMSPRTQASDTGSAPPRSRRTR